jgi:transposase
MTRKARPTYTAEFKAQAIELLALGKPVNEVAEELRVSSNLLYSWRRASPPQGTQGGSAGVRAGGEDSGADALRALRREIALLRAQNDILKKAAIILGTKTPLDCGR